MTNLTHLQVEKRSAGEDTAARHRQEHRRTVQLEGLNRLAAAVSASLNLDATLQTAMQIACDLTNAETCRVYLPDEQGQALHMKTSLGSTPELDEMLFSIPVQGSLTGRAFLSGQLVMVEDLEKLQSERAQETFYASHPALMLLPPKAFACVPLLSKGQSRGVMALVFPKGRRFDDDEKSLLAAIGHQVGVAVENAQLFERERRRAEELSLRTRQQQALLTILPEISSELHLETLLQRIVEEAVAVIPGAQRGSILFLQADGLHFMGAVGYDLAGLQQLILPPESLPPSAHPRYQIECIRDIDRWTPEPLQGRFDVHGGKEIKETLRAPIAIQGEVFGYLNLDNLETYDAFGPVAYEMVKLFAAQAAVAIANARLHSELEERVRQRTAEIRRQRDHTAAILQSVADGVVVTDLEGRIISTNPVADAWLRFGEGDRQIENQPVASFIQHLATYTEDEMPEIIEFPAWEQELEGTCWWLTDCVHENCPAHGRESPPCWQTPGAYCSLDQGEGLTHLDTKQRLTCPVRNKLQLVSLEAHVAELREGVTVQGKVIALRDVSRQRALDRLKSQFVSTVSHELRTPLANIKLYHNLLKRGRVEKRQHYMEVMEREIVRLERLIQDILDLSRLETQTRPPRLEAVDINLLLQGLVETHALQAESKGLNIHFEMSPESLTVNADPNQLLQVFTNLLTNALNYTPDGKEIWLSSGTWHLRDERWVEIGAVSRPSHSVPPPPNGDWAVVRVRDSGMGIPPEDLPRIFDRFYRGAKAGLEVPGTGLGLSIVREILDLHGGHVLVESATGIGSTFTVLLPLPEPEGEQRVSVLIVDDEEQIGRLITRFLSREGIETHWVPDGQQALEVLAAARPRLLILDLAMPVLDGYQVLEQLQARGDTPSLPVLVLSSWTEDKFQRVKRLGATDFLTKPFSGEVLVDVVKRLTARPNHTGGRQLESSPSVEPVER